MIAYWISEKCGFDLCSWGSPRHKYKDNGKVIIDIYGGVKMCIKCGQTPRVWMWV